MAISDTIRSTLSGLFGYGYSNGSGQVLRTAILPGSRIDYSRYAGQLWLNSVVAISLQWKAERLPLPLMQQSKIATKADMAKAEDGGATKKKVKPGSYVPLSKSDLVDLWNRPNEYCTRMDFEPSVAMSLDVDGNAYVLKVRDGAGRVKQLLWLSHTRIAPVVKDGERKGYAVDGNLKDLLPVEDVVHFRRGCDPDNPWIGISALKAQLRQVATDNEAATFTASIMRNMGIAGTVITPDDPSLRPTSEDALAIKKGFNEVTMGDQRGGTVVLLGKYKVSQPGFSPEQLCLKDLPRDASSRLAASIGTPLMALGLPDPDKTYSNLEQAIKTAWDGVKGTQRIIADGLRWNLLPDFGFDPYTNLIEYNYDEIQELQESLDSLWDRISRAYISGIITRNEGREVLSFDPDPDGDVYYPGTGGEAEPRTTQQYQAQGQAPTPPGGEPQGPMKPAPSANGNGKPKVPAGKGWY